MKHKEPTSTILVEDFMRKHDDFFTMEQLKRGLKMDSNHVSASLHHLRKFKVVDCMQEGDKLWWYALPKAWDTRQKIVVEIVPESTPRKKRKVKSLFLSSRPT